MIDQISHTPYCVHAATDSQPSILKLKAVFKRPHLNTAQPRRISAPAPQREKATPKPVAMEAEAVPAAKQTEGEAVVEMEVDTKRVKGRKPRTVSRVKKSGTPFAAKKQKAVKK